MTWPLLVLAVPSMLSGYLGFNPANLSAAMSGGNPEHGLPNHFAAFVFGPMGPHFEGANIPLMTISVCVALAGFALAFAMYQTKTVHINKSFAEAKEGFQNLLYNFSFNKWYMDDVYFGLVDRVFLPTFRKVWSLVDQVIVEGIVNGIGLVTMSMGEVLKYLQNGRGQYYALVIFAAVADAVRAKLGLTGENRAILSRVAVANEIDSLVLKVTFTEYEKAWTPVQKLDFEYVRSEMNPQFANIATPSEIVVAASFTLEFGGSQAEMHFCFPYSMLEPIRDVLYSSMQSDQLSMDKRWITTLRQQLQSAEVELTAELTHATVSLGQIQKMKVGDVTLDLKKVKAPVYNLATKEDHIAPAESVLYGSQFFGGPVKYVLAGSGHIAMRERSPPGA